MAKGGRRPGAGRPTVYQQHIAEAILEGIVNGKSMSEMCRRLGVSKGTVGRWAYDDRDGFDGRLWRARRIQVLGWFDDLREIPRKAYGKSMPDVQAAKLEIDVIKFALMRLWPAFFGERPQIDQSTNVSVVVLPDNHRFIDDADDAIDGEAVEVENGE